VSTRPGQMQLTRMLLAAHSKARFCVQLTNAAFVAEYAEVCSTERIPNVEETFKTEHGADFESLTKSRRVS
jgi:hypothetical protein